ncbi:hypothetical protein G7077_03335 [Sphingomonas piscis]|uniref:Uncharacterized protein n=1 Tax=Sphingomonas piscis TaxID=2714943 RepID=A0A6G7YMW8_9SPHN|nr:hypothetical protein [Sphingomonas piscis]QIK78089.1 hypothetical protein G7077_03335 [Sphingomonas piscis]
MEVDAVSSVSGGRPVGREMPRELKSGKLTDKLLAIQARVNRLISRKNRSATVEDRAEAKHVVAESLFFDEHWYLEKYEDVRTSGIHPLDHFMATGWREGRDPGPMFTTSAYLKAYEDVAAVGINPLVHFVEFGMAEGRHGFGERSATRTPVGDPDLFGPATPCFSMPKSDPGDILWVRGSELDGSDKNLFFVGDVPVGYASASEKTLLSNAVDELRWISGDAHPKSMLGDDPSPPIQSKIVDGWFARHVRLRTRWAIGSRPLVFRGFQLVPGAGTAPVQVGEGLVRSSLQVAEFQLRNPYFPVLVVLTSAEGVVEHAEVIPFPSLYRNGDHYAEALWAASGRTADASSVASLGQQLTAALKQLHLHGAPVENVAVDWSEPANSILDRIDLRQWLLQIFRFQVVRSGLANGLAMARPPSALEDGTGPQRLILKPDQLPTISGLVQMRAQAETGGSAAELTPAPLLVSDKDPSLPALLISASEKILKVISSLDIGLLRQLPLVSGGRPLDGVTPVAIRRRRRRPPSDEQRMVPVSGLAARNTVRAPITWLVDAQDTPDDVFKQQVRSIALQAFAEQDVLVLTGATASKARSAAKLFPGKVQRQASPRNAIRATDTPLTAIVRANVILHSNLLAGELAAMLQHPEVASASCAMVSAERRGGSLNAKVIHAGGLLGSDAADELWGEIFSVAAPSPHLWMARSNVAKSWLEGSAGTSVSCVHLFSARVSATVVNASDAPTLELVVPRFADTATKVERLIG